GEDLRQVSTASVDLVFSFMTLQHVPKSTIIFNYIREASRVLTEGGIAFLQFRVLPTGISFLTAKYYIATRWPPLLSNSLRRLWGLLCGHNRTRDHFAAKYESWRGCALKPSAIEAAAAAEHLHVEKAGD